jgi:hypothetical protein
MRSIELRCAIAHLKISRFRVRAFSATRNDSACGGMMGFASLDPSDESPGAAALYSNGKSILLRFSSQLGTGSFFERMKSGLNSLD